MGNATRQFFYAKAETLCSGLRGARVANDFCAKFRLCAVPHDSLSLSATNLCMGSNKFSLDN